MEFSTGQICRYGIYFALLLILRVDLIFINPDSSHVNVMYIVTILVGLLLNLLIVFQEKRLTNYSFAVKYILLMTIIVLFFVIYTADNYSYTLYQTISLTFPYLLIYYAMPIVYVLLRDERQVFLRTIARISFVFVVLRFFSWTSYNFFSASVVKGFMLVNAGWQRDGIYRITGGATFGFLYIYTVYRLLQCEKGKHKGSLINKRWKYIGVLCFLLSFSWFCTRARYPFLVQLFTIAISYFLIKNQAKKRVVIVFSIIVFLGIFLATGVFDRFVDSFSITGKYGTSTLARMLGVIHFWNLFQTVGNCFALGFVTNGYGTEHLFYRYWWIDFYIEDLGLLECFFRFGILFIPMYIWPFVVGIKCCIKSIDKESEERFLLIPLVVYFIACGLWCNIYYEQYAFCVPFYIAIFNKFLLKRVKAQCKKSKLSLP